ncbi:MAG: ABC-F family ATP-binding cassette domain-containing protein [Candidatus Yanofskybacteria bacterium]|nr:ABC-F family ATP-binding cassette domain-containing protein [Candidatus Yanofskybacteria bacterium]
MNRQKHHDSIIVTNDISFEVRSGVSIFRNLSVSFNGEKTGLVGKNGSGKTTLLRLLFGELEPTSGKIQRAGHIVYLPQDYQLNLQQTVSETLGVKEKLEALNKVESGNKSSELLEVVGKDWDIQSRISEIFKRLKIEGLNLNRVLSSLSGGERTKVVIAKLLISKPEFIILDEPTNNLDRESREIIYELIKNWQHGLLVVSHDRNLLNLLDQILELSNGKLKIYGGNYDNYKEQKGLEEQAVKRQLVGAEQELKKIKKQAQRTKEKQQKRSSQGKKLRDKIGMPKIILGKMKETSETTSSRLQKLHEKRIEGAVSNLDEAKAKISPENQINVDLSGTKVPTGKLIVETKDLNFSYEDNKPLFQNFTISLHGPIRLALNGPNGSGKTTLIKLFLKELEPLNGEVSLGVDKFAYLDQDVAVLQKDKTLIDNLKHISNLDDNIARKWLARFLFRNEDVFKKVEVLSGGERMRAALACILAGDKPPQLLILDEPTNNLDLDSIEQIESALLNFQGALIVISHDRNFLRNIGVREEITLLFYS